MTNETQYTYTKEEWLAEGEKLFGKNYEDWKCQDCEVEAAERRYMEND